MRLYTKQPSSIIIDNRERLHWVTLWIGIFSLIFFIIVGFILSYYTDPRLFLLMLTIGFAFFIGYLLFFYEGRVKAIRISNEGVVIIFRLRKNRLIKWSDIKGFIMKSASFREEQYQYGILLDTKNRRYQLNQEAAEAIDEGYLVRFGTHPPFEKDVYSGPFLGMQAK
jgi:hypothetical protein